jgi:hypothetical protein
MTESLAAATSRTTIGEIFHDLPDVDQISAGEFRVRWLKAYPHTAALEECCILAINELADLPYAGRKANAQVMGLAMQLLRERHGVNALYNRLPAMKRLRNQSNIKGSVSRGVS